MISLLSYENIDPNTLTIEEWRREAKKYLVDWWIYKNVDINKDKADQNMLIAGIVLLIIQKKEKDNGVDRPLKDIKEELVASLGINI